MQAAIYDSGWIIKSCVLSHIYFQDFQLWLYSPLWSSVGKNYSYRAYCESEQFSGISESFRYLSSALSWGSFCGWYGKLDELIIFFKLKRFFQILLLLFSVIVSPEATIIYPHEYRLADAYKTCSFESSTNYYIFIGLFAVEKVRNIPETTFTTLTSWVLVWVIVTWQFSRF